MGRELATQKSLSTQVFKIGGACRVTATLYDLKKSATERAAWAGAGCTENELLAAVEELARKLSLKKIDKKKSDPGTKNGRTS
jgi:hypothetical protein